MSCRHRGKLPTHGLSAAKGCCLSRGHSYSGTIGPYRMAVQLKTISVLKKNNRKKNHQITVNFSQKHLKGRLHPSQTRHECGATAEDIPEGSMVIQPTLSSFCNSCLHNQALREKAKETQPCIVTIIYYVCVFANKAYAFHRRATKMH